MEDKVLNLKDRDFKDEVEFNDLINEYWTQTGEVPDKIIVTYQQRVKILDFLIFYLKENTPKNVFYYNESKIVLSWKPTKASTSITM